MEKDTHRVTTCVCVYLIEEMGAVSAVQRAGYAMTTERRPVEDQPLVGDESRVLTHGPVHAPADRRRSHLHHVRRPLDELQTRVAGAALSRLLVGDQVAVGGDHLQTDDGVGAARGRVGRRDAQHVVGNRHVDADLRELVAHAADPVAPRSAAVRPVCLQAGRELTAGVNCHQHRQQYQQRHLE